MSSKLKYNIWKAHLEGKQVIPDKSVGRYKFGCLIREDLMSKLSDIEAWIKRRGYDFPIAVSAYHSRHPHLKTGLETKITKRGIEFEWRKQFKETRELIWFVDENKKIMKIGPDMNIIDEH